MTVAVTLAVYWAQCEVFLPFSLSVPVEESMPRPDIRREIPDISAGVGLADDEHVRAPLDHASRNSVIPLMGGSIFGMIREDLHVLTGPARCSGYPRTKLTIYSVV